MKNLSVILLAALALAYPALWWGGRMPGEWKLFSECAWSLACMLLLALVPDRLRRFADLSQENVRHVLYCMIPAGIILLMHYYFARGNTDLLCRGLFFLVLPILGAVYAGELKRPLLWAVVLLGAADAAVLGIQYFQGMPPYGITGNWNWSATLLAAAFLAGAGLLRSVKKCVFLAVLAVAAAVLYCLPSVWLEYFPRGTVLALGTAAGLTCCTLMPRKCRIAKIGLLLLLLAGVVFALIRMEEDISRSSLASGTIQMVKSHPLAGVGPGRFESEIPSFLPERYFEGDFVAERHTHPHNQLLKFLAESGIAGAVLFGAFCLILYRSGRRVKAGEDRALWAMAVMLTMHGMVDVLLEEWPLNVIWLLALGILWGDTVVLQTPDVPEMEKSDVYWPLRVVQILLAVLLCVQVVREGTSGFYARRAKLGGGAADWERSRMWKETPENLYAGAMNALFDRKDPAAALQFLTRMEYKTTFRNYLHNQGLTARALAADGKLAESLPYFESEQRNFPVSAVNCYFHAQVLQKLGKTPEAEAKLSAMHRILAARGRTVADLPELIRNPALELRKKK
ncbi:MAG: hypothetical protein IJC34_04170 [Lentisphaeria bacterium]|nr:hypothetical protein [Lentisphaeria bacterium]